MAIVGAGFEDQVRMILFHLRHVCSIRILEQFMKGSALGQIGLPTDIAALVSYLVSKESHLITGQSVSILAPYLSAPLTSVTDHHRRRSVLRLKYRFFATGSIRTMEGQD